MPRLLGVDIPNDKPIVISLRYLYGVGDKVARELCHKAGIETGIDTFALMDLAEDVVTKLLARPQVVDRSALILGYAGVYSSFLLHAEGAAARFGISAKEILVEVGRRKAVGGQEDLLLEIAAEMAAAQSRQAQPQPTVHQG